GSAIGAAVEEDAEEPRQRDAAAIERAQKARHLLRVMVADDLRQVELGVEPWIAEVVDLALDVGVRIRPAAERERVVALAEHLAKLPRVLDRSRRRADRLVAAEDDQRGEAALVRALRVRQTVLERVLRRQERNDSFARHVTAEIRDQMPQVVLFLR